MKIYADIVIVDSGVIKHKCHKGINILHNSDTKDFEDKIGHGTAVDYLINSYLKDVEIYHIKIFDDEFCTNVENLICALKFVYYNVSCKVVHLSNGVVYCEDIEQLRFWCDKLVNKGIIIVAAFDNGGSISYPAAFDNVIGVDISNKVTKNKEYYFVRNSYINIVLTSRRMRIPWKDGKMTSVQGSSFATPYITAKVCGCIKEKKAYDFKTVLHYLEKYAFRIIDQVYEENEFEMKIEKAIVFPYNKEIQNMLIFDHLLKFEIIDAYDTKYLQNVGKEVSGKRKKYTIKNFENINWNSSFDTVILGHSKELSNSLHEDFIKYILDMAIRYKKNVYCFDDLTHYEEQKHALENIGQTCFVPGIMMKEMRFLNNGKLRNIGKPIIGVFGTSSRQGKFTLQLVLREKFLRDGYKVGQLGTEPNSFLFGFDECYPIGYDSTVQVKGNETVFCINQMMGRIEDKNPDIVIAGAQSHTVPLSLGNIGFYTLYNVEFLLGTAPDIICLCVNINDDIQYIKRTISFLESYIETEVIGIVIFPVLNQEQWSTLGNRIIKSERYRLKEKAQEIKEVIGKNVYILGEREEMEELYQSCVEYFEV